MSIVLAYSKGEINVILSDGLTMKNKIPDKQDFKKIRRTGKNQDILFGITGSYKIETDKSIFDLFEDVLKDYEYSNISNFKCYFENKIKTYLNLEKVKSILNEFYKENNCYSFYSLFILPKNQMVKFYIELNNGIYKSEFNDESIFQSIGNFDLHKKLNFDFINQNNIKSICEVKDLFTETLHTFVDKNNYCDVNKNVFCECY
jgi:hypothetical protein